MKAWAIGDCDNGGDEWEEEIKLTEQAVQAINQLNPKPKFFVLCGDLIHGMPGTQWRKDQEQDLKNVLKNIDQDIPLVFVSGNHDIGNVPTPETIDDYCKHWGDDYFSFWVGGVFFLVLNSQLYFDSSKCPELKQAQDEWLDAQLAVAEKQTCKHVIVFQHIPLFLQNPDEDHDYFNLEKSVRQELMEKFHKAAVLDDDPAHIVGFTNTGTAALTKHEEGTNVRFLKIATALNPRIKNLKCLPKSEWDKVWSMLSEVLKEQHFAAETTEPEPPKKKINLLLVASDSNDENEHASVRSALDHYRAEPVISRNACPLEWWLKHEGRPYESSAHLTFR
ncbi:serine/threonine-protein phosphatase CPPED1 isoform X2 [Caretta caretta]